MTPHKSATRRAAFFKTHQDYLSLTSNCVEEYTLLLSTNTAEQAANAEGGQTRVYFEAGGKGAASLSAAYDTTAPNHALLFRKDLDHEAELLSAGEKNILSLNLLAFRKRASHQVLVVDFEPPHRTTDED